MSGSFQLPRLNVHVDVAMNLDSHHALDAILYLAARGRWSEQPLTYQDPQFQVKFAGAAQRSVYSGLRLVISQSAAGVQAAASVLSCAAQANSVLGRPQLATFPASPVRNINNQALDEVAPVSHPVVDNPVTVPIVVPAIAKARSAVASAGQVKVPAVLANGPALPEAITALLLQAASTTNGAENIKPSVIKTQQGRITASRTAAMQQRQQDQQARQAAATRQIAVADQPSSQAEAASRKPPVVPAPAVVTTAPLSSVPRAVTLPPAGQGELSSMLRRASLAGGTGAGVQATMLNSDRHPSVESSASSGNNNGRTKGQGHGRARSDGFRGSSALPGDMATGGAGGRRGSTTSTVYTSTVGGGGALLNLLVYLPNRAHLKLRVSETATVTEVIADLLRIVKSQRSESGGVGGGMPGTSVSTDASGHTRTAASSASSHEWPLVMDTRCFELRLHDENGEPDEDFPALDKTRRITNFGQGGQHEYCLCPLPAMLALHAGGAAAGRVGQPRGPGDSPAAAAERRSSGSSRR